MNKISYFTLISIIFTLVACGVNEKPPTENEGFSEIGKNLNADQTSNVAPVQTNVYRLLTAVRTKIGNKSILTVACEQELGFKRQMTGSKVSQAREINIPISATVYDPVVYVTRYRVELVQPPSVNGIVFNSEQKQVPYTVQEALPGPHYVEGSCLGSEYIIE
jgi:hypothetical protein